MPRIVAVICLVIVASWAHAARTPGRVCRKACAPVVADVCPERGKALRRCRGRLVRECRREGVAVCAFGQPTGTPPATLPVTTTTVRAATTTTTVMGVVPTTTTTVPPALVGGEWVFAGTQVQPGCGFDESFAEIGATLVVAQGGAALNGRIEGAAAAGQVSAGGWTFATLPDCRPVEGTEVSCCLSFGVASGGVVSPSPAEGTATGSCDDGSTCTARWVGSLTRTH
jgi:hypothetical protein